MMPMKKIIALGVFHALQVVLLGACAIVREYPGEVAGPTMVTEPVFEVSAVRSGGAERLRIVSTWANGAGIGLRFENDDARSWAVDLAGLRSEGFDGSVRTSCGPRLVIPVLESRSVQIPFPPEDHALLESERAAMIGRSCRVEVPLRAAGAEACAMVVVMLRITGVHERPALRM